MSLTLGLSSCGKTLDRNFFENCAKTGIKLVEVTINMENINSIDMKEIMRLAHENNTKINSVHLPFMPFNALDISSPNEERRLFAVNAQAENIKRYASDGAKLFVIHPSGEPIDEKERQFHLLAAKRSLSTLADVAEAVGVTLAVENLPRTCLANCSSELLSLVEDPRLRVCFDMNHLLSEDHFDFIRAVVDRIVTTHVSDYDRINERHWLPGEGVIDWCKVVSTLDALGYNGPFLYEVSFATPSTIKRERELTFDDISSNFEEIMNGVRPKAFGVPTV